MREEIERYRSTVKPGRDTRLLNEWERLDEACAASDEISYSVCKTNASGLPVVYEVIFRIKSITGVEEADEHGLQKPVFGCEHILRIRLPNNYPAADGGYPEFKFITDVWHPNVRYFGEFKGRVCLNVNDCGTSAYLTDHIATIAGYLRYTDYHARNEHPYPEDRTVAQWTLEQAEPQGWTKFNSLPAVIAGLPRTSCKAQVTRNPLNEGDADFRQHDDALSIRENSWTNEQINK